MQLEEYLMTATKLLANKYPPQQWLIDGVLPHPSLGELFAERGVGKTWAALSLAIAIAKGERWLLPGHEVKVPRRVLYIDGEMPEDELQTRVKVLSGGDVPNLTLMCLGGMGDRPNYGIATVWDRLLELMEEHDFELAVLDNWSSLVRGIPENDNDQTREVIDGPIILRANGRSVMWVHHAGKTGTQRGASSREDALDYVVELEKEGHTGGPVKFKAKLGKSRRLSTWLEPVIVELGSNGNGHSVWHVAADTVSPNARRVLEALKAAKKEPQSARALRMVTKLNGAKMGEALDELEGQGRIRQREHGWVVL